MDFQQYFGQVTTTRDQALYGHATERRSTGLHGAAGSAELTRSLAEAAGNAYIDAVLERRSYYTLEERADLAALMEEREAELADEYREELGDGIEWRDDGTAVVHVGRGLQALYGPDMEPEPASELRPRMVEALTVRWNVPIPAVDVNGQDCYVRYHPDSLDHLWDDPEQTSVPVLLGHATESRHHGTVRQPVGQVVRALHTDDGLVVTTVFGADPTSRAVLALCEDQVLENYSARSTVIESRDTGELHDGLPLYDILEARLIECGPCSKDEAGDPGAMILSANGQYIEDRAREVAEIESRDDWKVGQWIVRGWLGELR
jgi:hypothetical protein